MAVAAGAWPDFRRSAASLTLAGKLEPAMVVMVRGAAQPANPNARVPMRDATAPAPKVPILNVWDKAIHDAVAAAKPGPDGSDGVGARRRAHRAARETAQRGRRAARHAIRS